MKKKLLLLAVLGCLLYNQGNAQSPGTGSPASNPSPDGSNMIHKKGTFFITPYYEFTHFKNLELVEHTNFHSLVEGEFQDIYLQEDLDEYNTHYGTEYQSGLAGLKIGYQIFDGFGVSAYGGLTHFNFKSWISDDNAQHLSSQYPAVSFGGGIDYQKKLYNKLIAMSVLSVNYCFTDTPEIKNITGEKSLSSNMKSMFWELDLALAYPLGRFVPYAGAGFTQQFVHSVHEEQILTTDDAGNDFYNRTTFDSQFRGSSFYGFAGLEYKLNKGASVFLKSSFPNPFRSSFGFRIVL